MYSLDMEHQSPARSISQNTTIAISDVEVTDNCGDGIQSKLDFESDNDFNGSVEIEDNEVGDSQEELEEATKPKENVDSIHSRIRQELIPVIGMKFETEDDAHAFTIEGKREKDKRNPYVKSHRAETRFECLARMKINYQLSVPRVGSRGSGGFGSGRGELKAMVRPGQQLAAAEELEHGAATEGAAVAALGARTHGKEQRSCCKYDD
ncbi:hypothetical protein M0R45_025864 [Rubus argutus]|uniref:Uncharacterized protein n=1 Tax=Rubus argutus TaxID=59490 RepID=A0AAW1WXA7_RUBAR